MPGFTLSSWTRVYPFNLSICWTNGLNMFTGSIITVIVMATKFMPACVCVLIKVILSDVCAEPSSIVVCTFDKKFWTLHQNHECHNSKQEIFRWWLLKYNFCIQYEWCMIKDILWKNHSSKFLVFVNYNYVYSSFCPRLTQGFH